MNPEQFFCEEVIYVQTYSQIYQDLMNKTRHVPVH